ncbi:MAG TPA: sulfotransferase [Candidatus Limnocylindria bacterium]|nr:sulfotransferase [Candidatus Limnocylindria bacterium]
MAWQPQPRPTWVDAVNALGANLGCAGGSLVSLREEDLLAAARANTGLDDFGDAWFRQGLGTLLRALEEEARLTLVGRVLARAEIQRLLQNRLAVEAVLRAEPAIERAPVTAPIVITGLGRTGTTLLHDLLGQDPANRVPRQWELMYSVPPPDPTTSAADPRIERVRREITVMDEADPAFPHMHELAADLPTECIYVFAHEFASDMFVGEFNVPSYAVWQATIDLLPAYRYHRRFLQLLQWRHPGRWVLKAPSHLGRLRELFTVYPDARVVITHRDPLRVIGSLASLMATLQRMRSDHVDYDRMVQGMAFGFHYLVEKVMKQRAEGKLPAAQIADVRYADLVRDPVATVRTLYERWNIPFTETVADRIRRRLADQRHGQGSRHHYSFDQTGLDRTEQRQRFANYMAQYELPLEA